MIVAIDFDGTIVTNTYPSIGKLLPGAKETIQFIKKLGHEIIIWTCRNGMALISAKKFLEKEQIPFDRINEQSPDRLKRYPETRKISADIYIDDRNLFGFVSWEKVFTYFMQDILNTKELTDVDKVLKNFYNNKEFLSKFLCGDVLYKNNNFIGGICGYCGDMVIIYKYGYNKNKGLDMNILYATLLQLYMYYPNTYMDCNKHWELPYWHFHLRKC